MTLGGSVRRLARFDALVVTSLLWFLGKFLRYAFPPLFETLAGRYEVSTAVLGTAFSGFMLVYALMQFPSGLLADRFGSVTVIAAGALVASVGALVLVVDTPLAVLVGAMLLMGAGTGAHKTVSVRLLSRAYPSRTGRALGVFDTFGTFGGVAAPAAVVAFLALPGVVGASWRTTFLVGGVLGVALVAAFAVTVPRRLPEESVTPDAHGERVDFRTYARLFREWRFSAFVAVTILFSFAYSGAVAFLPLYLTREAGLSSATANLLFSGLFLVSLVQLVTGEASDRVGTLPVIVGTLSLASAGLIAVLALTESGSTLALAAAVGCLGLGAHGYRPVRGAYLMSVVPDSVAGGSLGAVRTLLMAAAAVAPALVGALSETVGFKPVFAVLAAGLVGAAALAAVLWVAE